MKRIILITLSLILLGGTISAQQDCPQVDCPGICGRFIDNDGDDFCDHGKLSKPKVEAKAEPAVQQPKAPKPKKVVEPSKREEKENDGRKDTSAKTEFPAPAPAQAPSSANSSVQRDCQQVDCKGRCGRFVDNDGDGFCDHGRLSQPKDSTSNSSSAASSTESSTGYPVYLILGGTLLLYLISFILVKANAWSKSTHRKIWNVTLTATFLVSCLLGLLLAIFIRHDYFPDCYRDILSIHVWFGIAMTIIACFHALWHLNYYKTLFQKKR